MAVEAVGNRRKKGGGTDLAVVRQSHACSFLTKGSIDCSQACLQDGVGRSRGVLGDDDPLLLDLLVSLLALQLVPHCVTVGPPRVERRVCAAPCARVLCVCARARALVLCVCVRAPVSLCACVCACTPGGMGGACVCGVCVCCQQT